MILWTTPPRKLQIFNINIPCIFPHEVLLTMGDSSNMDIIFIIMCTYRTSCPVIDHVVDNVIGHAVDHAVDHAVAHNAGHYCHSPTQPQLKLGVTK